MSNANIVSFNDLNNFCDNTIFETQKWCDALKILTEEYTNFVKNNENACTQLHEIHQRMNFLNFSQEILQRNLFEAECNYNAMLKRVEELEAKMIDNEYCEQNAHYSVYQNAIHLNSYLNSIEDFIENLNVCIHNEDEKCKEKNSKPSCQVLISKQLELLECLERKMYTIWNEVQSVERLRNRIFKEITDNFK